MKTRETIHSSDAPAAIGPYSQAVRVDKTVYLSGQIPLNPLTMDLVDSNFEAQIHQVIRNLQAVCSAAGGELKDLVKLNIYLTDLANFAKANEVMQNYFVEPYPARAAIGVASLPKGALIEIDGVLVLPENPASV